MPNRDMTGTGGPNPTSTTNKGPSESQTRNQSSSPAGGMSGQSGGQSVGRDSVDDVKKTVNRAAGDAMSAGRDTLDSAQGRIRSLLEQQTDRAADQLGGVANALHKAAEQLNAENNGVVADYAVQAADRVERVADMLRDASLDDIVGEVEGFARRQPEVFIGAAFAVGFLAARFIKSSGERRMHRSTTALRSSRATGGYGARGGQATRHDTGRDDMNRGPSRGMAGGIGESVGRASVQPADLPTSTGDRMGEPKPAAARIGMPLSSAPASTVTGRTTPSSADTALGTSTVGTGTIGASPGNAGSTMNAGTTGVSGAGIGGAGSSGSAGGTSGTQGAAAGTTSTSKPQGQRP
ncbi:hypothetical protein [Azospirillum sp. TSO35-2]|uniref:hypothetical protein n=1 Tax=Azospirillum sp. TSO35-2 TaxID=716796 RepID=UPI000D61685B|nr:hypothetical protein [Azospirillum sp. TSO35-2]PWC33333.1 hypothetical protein TSO352_22860 [Azospirillum sp. TSO35-2]